MALFEERTSVTLAPTRPRAWAGLRTFASDRAPIVGFEDDEAPFFWLCGQGGYGIQTAEAMAELAAGLIIDRAVPPALAARGLKASDLHPNRPALSPRRVGVTSAIPATL